MGRCHYTVRTWLDVFSRTFEKTSPYFYTCDNIMPRYKTKEN